MTARIELDDADKALLRVIQGSFPLSPDPWQEIGEEIGLPREEVLAKIRALEEKKVIKRIGPVIESRSLGLGASTLVLARVPPQRLEEVAEIVNACEGVTHNYQRDGDFNLWFTLQGEDRRELESTIQGIMARAGIGHTDFFELPTVRRFKIGVRYDIE